MDSSVFMDKSIIPDNDDVEKAVGELAKIWFKIRELVIEKYPEAKEEWNFPGKKYGWSFRIKDKKRA